MRTDIELRKNSGHLRMDRRTMFPFPHTALLLAIKAIVRILFRTGSYRNKEASIHPIQEAYIRAPSLLVMITHLPTILPVLLVVIRCQRRYRSIALAEALASIPWECSILQVLQYQQGVHHPIYSLHKTIRCRILLLSPLRHRLRT